MDLTTGVVGWAMVALLAILATQHRKVRKSWRKQIVTGAATAVTLALILNAITFFATASADHRPPIHPNDVAAAYGMPVDVAAAVEFGVQPVAGHQSVFVINPYRPRSVDGRLIVTFFGTKGVPAVFEVPNKKLHLRQTVSASQPTSLTVVLDKTVELGKRELIKQSNCRLSMETAVATCVRTEVYSTELGARLTNQGLGSVVENELTDVTLVVPANIYRMLREDQGKG